MAVEEINKAGGFNEDFTPEGFRILVNDAAKRDSQIVSASQILGDPDPKTVGTRYLEGFETSTNPTDFLRQTLTVLKNGELPDGSNPALEGFKYAVGVALVKKAVTDGTGSGFAAEQAAKLSKDRRTTVKLWDPEELVKISGNERSRMLLRDLYGNGAAEVFNKISVGAQDQFLYSQQARSGVKVQDLISDEWAGNLGRVIGGGIAALPFVPVSGLVLTGVGRRFGINTLGEVRGSAVDKLIVDLLMQPKLWAAAVEKFPIANASADLGPWDRLKDLSKKWAQHRFIDDNARRIERFGRAPGVLFEIGAEALDMREPDDESIGPQSSLQPASPPARQMAAAMPAPRAPRADSTLGQVSPISPISPISPAGQAPAAPAQAPQETLARLDQLGMSLFDTVNAKHGGYIEKSGIMSVNPKARQLVG